MRGAPDIDWSWLLRLRWGAIAGQALTIVGVHFVLDVRLPLLPLAAILGFEVASNLAARAARSTRAVHLAALLALDVVTLTALLYFTGGPYNPFSFLYLVYIALAAVVLPVGWTWALTVLSLASFGALFAAHQWLETTAHLRMHVSGMWVAFAVAAVFTVHFVSRVTRALAQRDAELARASRLVSLATLAAGAAHELATPLATIAVASRELERRLDAQGDGAAKEDARLIRSEVERCRGILEQLASDAGQSSGGAGGTVTVAELVAAVSAGRSVAVAVADDVARLCLRVPLHPLSQALRGLVKNAEDAAGDGVELRCGLAAGTLRVEVRDRGPGMPPEVLARAGEPFFTTKEAGHGMGLGLFLARTVLERLGGALALESHQGQGTRAIATLPLG